MMLEQLGFIGLGAMGSRMAANLQKSGSRLVVFNRTRDKGASLVRQGATWADTPAAVAEQVEVLFTMLAHPDAVHEAALGPGGFLDRLRPQALWVDCSSVNPSFSREMASEAQARKLRFLDAPVAGSREPAARAELTFFVGGDAADLQACRPLLQTMGSKILHVGGHGMGSALKMVNNLLLASSMAAFAEGLVLGQALGISQERLFEFLMGTSLVAPYLASKRQKIERGDYAAEFPLQWMQKDLHLAAVSAQEAAVGLPLTNAAKETYRLAARHGRAQEDFSAIYAFLMEIQDAPGRSRQ
jgi:3-hydroxyisobutyrate dehydrogenase/glyoxylate/succinic semialdehyde reductase